MKPPKSVDVCAAAVRPIKSLGSPIKQTALVLDRGGEWRGQWPGGRKGMGAGGKGAPDGKGEGDNKKRMESKRDRCFVGGTFRLLFGIYIH